MGLFDFLKKKNAIKEKPVDELNSEEEEGNQINQSFINDGVRFEFPDHSRIDLIEDKFEKTKILRFYCTGPYGLDKYMVFTEKADSFLIGFRVQESRILLIISTYQKEIKLSKDDSIRVLFDDEEVVDLKLEKNGYKHDKDEDGVITESFATIDEDTLKRFVEHDIQKIRLQTKDGLNHNIDFDLNTAENFCEAGYAFYYSLKNFYQKDEYISEKEYKESNQFGYLESCL